MSGPGIHASRWSLHWIVRHVIVTALVGVAGGVAGIVAYLGLQLVQMLAFGFPFGSSKEAADAPSAIHRLIALLVAGVIAALVWWAIRRRGRVVATVEDAVDGRPMPAVRTVVNAGVQIVAVGLGASIGKEGAPRELGAWMSGLIAARARLDRRETRVLIACGAAAGLAAIYNVPLAGALFAVEVLLGEISFATALPAFATSAIAAFVARLVVPVETLYRVPHVTMSPSLVVWSILAGPLLGLLAVGFVALVRVVRGWSPRRIGILWVMPIAFAVVGVIALWFPSVLGNGRALGLLAMNQSLSRADIPSAFGVIGLMALLAILKGVTTLLTMGSGAVGGTLTPSIAIGAAAGAALGGLWILAWPGSNLAAFAFIGAAAFLATTMRAPFTSLVLVIEFTGQGPDILIPSLLAVSGSVAVAYVLGRRRLIGVA
ncbi:chloride channel protein [Pseudolysinimonas sp.]|uniref:chloride channel protein n=1 Tax=Pseudolysinimonas sp. TaxID=2680009 RepID=UPI003F7E7946